MIIVRRYKKMGWWDFVDQIEIELEKTPTKEVYIELLDELRMRLIESVSEGGSFKLKAPAKKLLEEFEKRMSEDKEFASKSDYEEALSLAKFVID